MSVDGGDIVRCIAQQQDMNGSIIQNVFFYGNKGVAGMLNSSFLTGVEAELSACFANLSTYMPSSCEPTTIVCDKVEFSGGKLVSISPVGEIAWTTWAGGTGTGDGLPQGNACVLNFPTDVAGVQGRKYIGPLTEGAQENGVLVSALQTALAAFVSEFLDGFTVGADDLEPVLMSFKQASAVDIASGIVKAIVGYQRRRKAGVGA